MMQWIFISAVASALVSGVPGLFLRRDSSLGQWIAAALSAAASILGLWAGFHALLSGSTWEVAVPLTLPGTEISMAMDPLAAAFLLPIFLISGLGACFGLEYWSQAANQSNGRKLRLFYGLLTGALALLVVARNGVFFLMAWEVMALSAFFAVTTEGEKKDVQEAGWVYFAATHVSTLLLFAFFALFHAASGSFELKPFAPGAVSSEQASGLFLLALGGFGLKAGLYPLHFWLPPAHASAPSHVSALMSGVLIKMGVYGIVRVLWLFPDPPLWWGEILLVLGGISGVLGVLFAIGQHDLKRLLAYHSIENIGIIFMGLGLASAGRTLGRADWVALGLAGAILHTWNHGLFKALLFLAAGSAIHAVHTREIDKLGGLAKKMPATSACFLIGAAAICGLPPLNGFVSEFLVYLGLFRAWRSEEAAGWGYAPFAIATLGLIGALAAACFVKVFGAVFLGQPRTSSAQAARESGPAIIQPMAIIVVCCFLIGVCPFLVAPLLDVVLRSWAPALAVQAGRLTDLAPLGWLSCAGVALAAAAGIGALFLCRRHRDHIGHRAPAANALPTWDCGYSLPTPAMQYTSSSFAQILVSLFGWILLPKTHAACCRGPFPPPASFHSHVPDTVLDRAVVPTFRSIAWAFSWFRLLQRGKINAYLFYIFITLLVLLLWK